MFLSFVLSVVCFTSGVLSSFLSPCKVSDQACIEKSVNGVVPQIVAGIPELGVESSDPLFVDKIEGNLSTLKYKFFNSTVRGYKDCAVSNITVNEDLSTLHFDLTCPKLNMNGQYEINGRLFILPVEGKGDFEIISGKYLVNVDCELKKVQGKDGKTHLLIKNFKLKCQPISTVKYSLKNLFNGQRNLADALHKFTEENWLEVTELLQDPTWYSCVKKVMSNVNKYLKYVALEDVVLN